ncbi:MAG: DUF4252 domain-containing protein [Congregibacter sp.]|nr:DUF4252 domain-containing protein [Congregibacter sp.]
MIVKIASIITLSTLLLGCGVTAPSHNPGYVQFDSPIQDGVHKDTVISLGPRLLRFAARHVDNDPGTKALLQSLDGVRVRVFQLDPDTDFLSLSEKLGIATSDAFDESWSPVVRIADLDSRVQVFIKEKNQTILGLAIVSIDNQEIVFVNVMGEISPEQLTSLSTVVPHGGALGFNTFGED